MPDHVRYTAPGEYADDGRLRIHRWARETDEPDVREVEISGEEGTRAWEIWPWAAEHLVAQPALARDFRVQLRAALLAVPGTEAVHDEDPAHPPRPSRPDPEWYTVVGSADPKTLLAATCMIVDAFADRVRPLLHP